MRRPSTRRRAGRGAPRDRGAILVEAALVLPVLLTLVLGLADLANLSLQHSQASSTARDGARTAILHYECADSTAGACSTSTDAAAVRTAVTQRLAAKPDVTVTVRCIAGATSTPEPCLNAAVDTDLVEVTVSWPMKALSFVGASFTPSRISASSRMAIVGLPLTLPSTTTTSPATTTTTVSSSTSTSTSTTIAPPTCAIVGSPTLPPAGSLKGNSGKLSGPVVITVATNGSTACTGVDWQLTRIGGPTLLNSPYDPTATSSSQVQFTLGADDGWAAGGYTFSVRQNGTAVITFSFTVS